MAGNVRGACRQKFLPSQSLHYGEGRQKICNTNKQVNCMDDSKWFGKKRTRPRVFGTLEMRVMLQFGVGSLGSIPSRKRQPCKDLKEKGELAKQI